MRSHSTFIIINSYFPPHIKSIAINCFVSPSSLFFTLKSNCVCGNGQHWHRVPNELRAATSELTVNQRREENPQFAAIFTFHLHPTTSIHIYLHPPSSIQNQSQPLHINPQPSVPINNYPHSHSVVVRQFKDYKKNVVVWIKAEQGDIYPMTVQQTLLCLLLASPRPDISTIFTKRNKSI